LITVPGGCPANNEASMFLGIGAIAEFCWLVVVVVPLEVAVVIVAFAFVLVTDCVVTVTVCVVCKTKNYMYFC